jgi:hypothetical protein
VRTYETNHLRKFAKEAGKQMRPRKKRKSLVSCRHVMITDKRICCACGQYVPNTQEDK